MAVAVLACLILVGVLGESPAALAASDDLGCDAEGAGSCPRQDMMLLQRKSVLTQATLSVDSASTTAAPATTAPPKQPDTAATPTNKPVASTAAPSKEAAAEKGAALPANTTANKAANSSVAVSASSSPTSSDAGCVTRHDARVHGMWANIAEPGTPCVFGADARDEGKHCIEENGDFGTFGWCWTSKSKDTWGACTETCPPIGQAAQLADRLDDVKDGITNIAKIIMDGPGSAAKGGAQAEASAAKEAGPPSGNNTNMLPGGNAKTGEGSQEGAKAAAGKS